MRGLVRGGGGLHLGLGQRQTGAPTPLSTYNRAKGVDWVVPLWLTRLSGLGGFLAGQLLCTLTVPCRRSRSLLPPLSSRPVVSCGNWALRRASHCGGSMVATA